jgi:hypothetical protein
MNTHTAPPTVLQLRQQRLVRGIAEHLAQHPQAADSAHGVARWWLGARGVQAEGPEVEQALLVMVAQQRLRCTPLADGTVLYSRSQSTGLL